MGPKTGMKRTEQVLAEHKEEKVRKISAKQHPSKTLDHLEGSQSGTPAWLCEWYDLNGHERDNY